VGEDGWNIEDLDTPAAEYLAGIQLVPACDSIVLRAPRNEVPLESAGASGESG